MGLSAQPASGHGIQIPNHGTRTNRDMAFSSNPHERGARTIDAISGPDGSKTAEGGQEQFTPEIAQLAAYTCLVPLPAAVLLTELRTHAIVRDRD